MADITLHLNSEDLAVKLGAQYATALQRYLHFPVHGDGANYILVKAGTAVLLWPLI